MIKIPEAITKKESHYEQEVYRYLSPAYASDCVFPVWAGGIDTNSSTIGTLSGFPDKAKPLLIGV